MVRNYSVAVLVVCVLSAPTVFAQYGNSNADRYRQQQLQQQQQQERERQQQERERQQQEARERQERERERQQQEARERQERERQQQLARERQQQEARERQEREHQQQQAREREQQQARERQQQQQQQQQQAREREQQQARERQQQQQQQQHQQQQAREREQQQARERQQQQLQQQQAREREQQQARERQLQQQQQARERQQETTRGALPPGVNGTIADRNRVGLQPNGSIPSATQTVAPSTSGAQRGGYGDDAYRPVGTPPRNSQVNVYQPGNAPSKETTSAGTVAVNTDAKDSNGSRGTTTGTTSKPEQQRTTATAPVGGPPDKGGCWIPDRRLLSCVVVTKAVLLHGETRVTYRNDCNWGVYLGYSNQRQDGSWDGGATHLSAGKSTTWWTSGGNGSYQYNFTGSATSSGDWVCASSNVDPGFKTTMSGEVVR